MYEVESEREPSSGPDVIVMDSAKHKNGKQILTLSSQPVTKAKSNRECAPDQPQIIKFHDTVETSEVAQPKRKKRASGVCCEPVSNQEILWYLLQLNKDSLFKVKLIGSCVTGALDVLTDGILAFDWYRQGHVWWASILISMMLLSSVATCVHRTWGFKRCRAKGVVIALISLIGLGPCTAVPYIIEGRMIGNTSFEEGWFNAFLWYKFFGVALESGPCFLLTSYTAAVSLFSDRDAPDVIPITWVSFAFSVGSISLTLLSIVEFYCPSKITVINQIEGFALNFCDLWFNALALSLFIAVMGVSLLFIIPCLCIVSVLTKSVELWYYNVKWKAVDVFWMRRILMICLCCMSVLVTAPYRFVLFRITRYCIYLSLTIGLILSRKDDEELQSAVLIWSCVTAGILTIVMDIHLTLTDQRFWEHLF